jgi:alanine racemase
VVEWGLTPAVTTIEFARALSERAVVGGVDVPVHVKIDTGMSRYGLMQGGADFLQAPARLPGKLKDCSPICHRRLG